MAVTPDQITAWANGIGLARCVGEEFVQQFGRLPNSIPELEQWGDSTGRRASGNWTCLGSGGGTGPTPIPPGTPPGGIPGIGGGGDMFGQITAFVKANPIPSAIVAYLLFFRRR